MRVSAMTTMAKHIVHEIQAGRDGSINVNGYASKVGFMVGGYSLTLVGKPELFDHDSVFQYIAENESFLFDSDNHYVGWWTDNGKVYLDISVRAQQQ